MNKFYYLLLAFIVLIADQVSKWAITQHVIKPYLGPVYGAPQGFWEWLSHASGQLPFVRIEMLPFFNIVMVWNKGVSFGMFNNGGEAGTIALIILALIILVFFLIWMFKTDSLLQGVSIALVIGGAIGNVLDRARFGAVVDFLDFHIFGFHWPAFNVSDSAIVIGVFLLIIHSFFFENNTARVK